MDRTYPREISLTEDQFLLIDQIRDNIGDPIVFKREYILAVDSLDNFKIVANGTTYYESNYFFWPYNIKVGDTTYSGITLSGINPSVSRYQYLEFSTISGGSLAGQVIDFSFDTFKLPDKTIWEVYESVDLTGLVYNPACITDYMIFLKACIDLGSILRTRRMKDDYSAIEIVDADTRYGRQIRQGVDPFKDLFDGLQTELDGLIAMCNKKIFTGYTGIRVE